ncbi:MAG TPA: glycosyltransferase [Candidatus Dormibacteraeota bacterium]
MSPERRCIFYRPSPLDEDSRSGSGMRPASMLRAFRQLGYEVDVVAGRAVDRRKLAHNVRSKLNSGVRYEFLYAEPPTTPTLLTEPHHIPTHPLMDYMLLLACRSHRVPVVLFYCDVHWRLPHYRRRVGWLKYLALLPFFHLDLLAYRGLVDALLVPDARMLRRIASWAPRKPHWTSMPGFDDGEALHDRHDVAGAPLRVLYVGGVEPPVYDLIPLLRASAWAVAHGADHTVTICSREPEWIRGGGRYAKYMSAHVKVVHNKTRAELLNLYAAHDVSVMPYGTLNSDWAMPIKFAEAIGMGLPVLAGRGTAVGGIVEQEGIGWVVGEAETDLADLLRRVDAAELERARAAVRRLRPTYSWVERALEIVAIAEAVRGGGLASLPAEQRAEGAEKDLHVEAK